MPLIYARRHPWPIYIVVILAVECNQAKGAVNQSATRPLKPILVALMVNFGSFLARGQEGARENSDSYV